MKEMTRDEYQKALKDQGVDKLQMGFVCPQCKTVQCAQELIDAGAGKTFEDVQGYLGFSCVGRFTKDKGCNWTLGGLFKIHELLVVMPDGEKHPSFMPATPEQMQALNKEE